jgi:hypothetical protein
LCCNAWYADHARTTAMMKKDMASLASQRFIGSERESGQN